jgi:ribonuclease P protein component
MTPESKYVPKASSDAVVEARESRLRKHAEYQRVYQASRKQFSGAMSWFAARREDSGVRTDVIGPRVGLTVGKVLGKAVDRNRIKRRMRAAVRANLSELPAGVDVILHPKRLVKDADFGKLQSEIQRIFRQVTAQTEAVAKRGAQLSRSEKAEKAEPQA